MSEPTSDPIDEVEIPWRPGLCRTPNCGHPVLDGVTFCPPCEILFGPYDALIAHDDVTEWTPPKPKPKRAPRKPKPKEPDSS